MRRDGRILWDGRLFVVLLALALGGLTVWSLRYFGRYQPFANFLRGSNRPSQIGVQVQGATVIGRERGKPRWRLVCRTITFSRDWRQVTLDGITQGILYDTMGRPNVKVTAAHASYSSPVELLGEQLPGMGGLLRMDGGVRATMPARPGWALGTPGLVWDAARNQARCVGIVTARYPGGGATATDVLVNTKTGDLYLHNLRGTLQVPRGEIF